MLTACPFLKRSSITIKILTRQSSFHTDPEFSRDVLGLKPNVTSVFIYQNSNHFNLNYINQRQTLNKRSPRARIDSILAPTFQVAVNSVKRNLPACGRGAQGKKARQQ